MWLTYDNKYEVSSEGEVRHKKSQKILKGYLSKGYKLTRIRNDENELVRVWFHRMIASVFLPTPTSIFCVVDHIDRDRTNNHPSNLRWVSISQNSINSDRHNTDANSNSGHHHIIKRPKGMYYVQIIRNKKNACYCYTNSLEEAIKARDDFLTAESSLHTPTPSPPSVPLPSP